MRRILLTGLLAASALASEAARAGGAEAGVHFTTALRPGGGQSFSSGRSSGGGSRSTGGGSHSTGGGFSSGGSSHSTGFSTGYSTGGDYTTSSSSTPGTGGESPLLIVGIFVAICVVIVIAKALQSASTGGGPGADAGPVLNAQYDYRAAQRRSASLDTILAHDPTITEASITERVKRMSVVLRDTWCAGDMRAARSFVSDGVYNRFGVQLALMRMEGTRNVMADASVLYCTVEAVETHPPLDVVHVRFTARAKDITVPLATPAAEIDQKLRAVFPEPYTEIWTLVRKVGAQSKLSPEQVGVNCPSCGAPLGEGEIIKCKYCNALVCSGEHDWVLAEITQISEWSPQSADRVAGLEQLQGADTGLAREVLEDRASFLFWKWVEAVKTQSVAPLRKFVSPAFLGQIHPEAVASATNMAVGGADVVLVDPGDPGDVDHVYVKIYWSAAFRQGASPTPMQSILKLARRTGVLSKTSMTAMACGSCGAPLLATDSPRCDHCGTDLSAGTSEWVLDAILPPGGVHARSHAAPTAGPVVPDWAIPRVEDPRDRELMFGQMAALMSADGVLAAEEQRLLKECARRWAIPNDKAEWMIARPPAMSGRPHNPEWFLAGLVAAAYVDGKVDAREKILLQRARAALNVPVELLDQQLQDAEARMARRS